MDFIVGKDGENMLLRSYLKHLHISGKQLSHLKMLENGITVNGKRVTVRTVLSCGDVIGLALEDTCGSAAKAVDLPLSILYEDDDIVVCNKPADMPTHPSHDHYDDTLGNALAFYYSNRPFVFRPVNRLDRNTSGAVIVAKNIRASAMMYSEMMKHRISKTYIAVVEGELAGEGRIEKSLRRTEKSIIVREVCDDGAENAQKAITEYRGLACGNGMSLVLLRPLTGRTHQLRVHLMSIGHPIVGDSLYGHESELIARQALHAEAVSFRRPCDIDRNDMTELFVNAPIPDDMLTVINSMGYKSDNKVVKFER